jgi:hypothetical protein
MKGEVSEREGVIKKRQDFFEGRHHKWTNVVGQVNKRQEGHIQVVINYIARFCEKLIQSLVNHPPVIKVESEDEANDIETSRSETVEKAISTTFKENKFFPLIYEKCATNQVRDADFIIDCRVIEDKVTKKKKIVIKPIEDLLKVKIGWDDASGSSYSFYAYEDLISIDYIEREYGFKADPVTDVKKDTESKGDHKNDQYGMFASPSGTGQQVPTGENQLPKAKVTDYWGYEVIKNEKKVINIVYINNELKQFYVTNYKRLPQFIGHSITVSGKPWSAGFIDKLGDPQIELNDRSGEEGDMVRIGSHQKFLVINMPDFDPNSVLPGSGQCIFLEGDNVDFRPLNVNIQPFPSESYKNSMLDHLFNLGIPKIGLAAGTAPYTGRVGAIQYQPIEDLVVNFRLKWEVVLTDLVDTIQQYFIDYFPETHAFMTESIYDELTKTFSDGGLKVREINYDWENVLPLSRSDKVIDASTMRDRGAISLHTYLGEAGFKDPMKEIKKLKKESQDPELMVLVKQFNPLAPGVVEAQLEARKKTIEAEEANAETAAAINGANQKPTPATPAPIQSSEQNSGRRGILAGAGSPNGSIRTPAGAVAQTSQNINAQAGQ